jgi:hypothetical protein
MTVPGREGAEAITWQVDGLLADGHLLPPALAAALRAYRENLLRHCEAQPWAQPGNRTRYARLAGTLAARVADGTWKPGQRLPFLSYRALACDESGKTVRQAGTVPDDRPRPPRPRPPDLLRAAA